MFSSASNVAFICSLAVVVVPILDLIFHRKSKNLAVVQTILPAVLATIGVACLELGGPITPGVGDLWVRSLPCDIALFLLL